MVTVLSSYVSKTASLPGHKEHLDKALQSTSVGQLPLYTSQLELAYRRLEVCT